MRGFFLYNLLKINKFRLQIPKTVSYTHLDVYKRQDLCNALKYGLNLNIETITHYNFACPRVGDDNFSNAYINYCIEEKKCNIIRFVNYYDYIPCFTPQFFSYKHVTDYYLFNFFVNVNDKCELENALAQHSIASYQNVLNAILIQNKTSGLSLIHI